MYTDLSYVSKIVSMSDHPFKPIINDTSTLQIFINCSSIPRPFPLRVKEQAEEYGISLNTYKTTVTDFVAPWEFSPVTCDMSFQRIDKHNKPRELLHNIFYTCSTMIYTQHSTLLPLSRDPRSHVLHTARFLTSRKQ